jgi:hypothetical protein
VLTGIVAAFLAKGVEARSRPRRPRGAHQLASRLIPQSAPSRAT